MVLAVSSFSALSWRQEELEVLQQGEGLLMMNPSFNLRGEAIVTTSQNAYSSFARSEMDLLVMGDCLVANQDMR